MSASQPFAPKQGFTVPIGAWMASQAQRLGPLVAAQPGVAEVAYPDRVTRLFERAAGKREGMAAWMLLFYALWHRVHVEDRGRDADVFDALS
jgi:asparagine synthase (glutamine-hydrolysing)